MDCVYCKKQLKDIKRDWATRKFHKSCYKKQKDIRYVDNLVAKYKNLQISNFS